MPYAKARAALAGIDELALTIALPRDHKPHRMPTFPALERTAVISTLQTRTVSVTPSSTSRAIIVRSPVFPVWFTQTVTAAGAYSGYLFEAANQIVSLDAPPNFERSGVYGTVPIAEANFLALGSLGQSQYLYCPQGASLQLLFSAGSPGTNPRGTVTVEYYDGVKLYSVEYTLGTLSSLAQLQLVASLSQSVWVRLISLNLIADNGTWGQVIADVLWITGGLTTAPTGSLSGLFPIGPVPEFANSTLPYASTRSNAVAALFSNVSAVLSKEGTIRATRLPRQALNPWSDFTNTAAFTASHPAETYFGPLEKGLYTFTLADEATSKFVDARAESVGPSMSALLPCMPLDGFEYVNCVLFSDLDPTTSTNLAITVDSHLEFRTNSALFNLGYSVSSIEAFHLAQLALVKRGVFYENPTHMATLAGLLRSAVSAVMPSLKTVAMSAASAAGQKVLSMAKSKIGQMTQANPGSSSRNKPKPRVVRNTRKTIRVKGKSRR